MIPNGCRTVAVHRKIIMLLGGHLEGEVLRVNWMFEVNERVVEMNMKREMFQTRCNFSITYAE